MQYDLPWVSHPIFKLGNAHRAAYCHHQRKPTKVGVRQKRQSHFAGLAAQLRGRFRKWLSGVPFVEQGLGLLQIERYRSFDEPAVDRSEKSGLISPDLTRAGLRFYQHCHRFANAAAETSSWLSEFRMARSIIARLAKGIAEHRSTTRGPFGRIVAPKDFCRMGQFRLLLGQRSVAARLRR
jgi:hypothetical protein